MKTSIVICASWILGVVYAMLYIGVDGNVKKAGLFIINVALLTALQLVVRGE